MLAAVDATPDQKSRIMTILGGAMPAMGAVHERMHDSMKSFHALLLAPTIDRGALESLRATEIADHRRVQQDPGFGHRRRGGGA